MNLYKLKETFMNKLEITFESVALWNELEHFLEAADNASYGP